MAYNLAAARRAIFAECRKQGLDEETRHALVRDVGFVASGSMSDVGAEAARRILQHLRRGEGNEWAFIDRAAQDNRPLLRKICMVCRAMSVGKAYAEGVAKRQHGIERRLEMMSYTELWHVAGALERTRKFKAKGAPPPEGGIAQDERGA